MNFYEKKINSKYLDNFNNNIKLSESVIGIFENDELDFTSEKRKNKKKDKFDKIIIKEDLNNIDIIVSIIVLLQKINKKSIIITKFNDIKQIIIYNNNEIIDLIKKYNNKNYKIYISNLDNEIKNKIKLLKFKNINLLNDNNKFEFL